MKFSPNGKYVVLGTSENLLLLLDATSGLITQRLLANYNPSDMKLLPMLDFTPDSRFLMSGSLNPQQNVFIWNLDSGQQVPLMQFHLANTGS